MATGNAVCVLVSGGLDSDVLVAELARQGRTVWPLYIRQGLTWEKVELYWLRRFLRASAFAQLRTLTILSLPMRDLYGAHWSTRGDKVPGARTADRSVYLPGRNLILTVKAAVFCALHKIPSLALAPLGHNPFPDAAPKFFRSWQKTVSSGLGWRLEILTPYRHLQKEQVIERGQRFPLHLSFSCLAPRATLHCGRCNKCAERRKAFRRAEIKDLTVYAR